MSEDKAPAPAKEYIRSGNERRRGPTQEEAEASEGIWGRCIFTGRNVVDEARERIRILLAEFDEVVVSFSGGKDSLACLHLVRQEMDAMGMDDIPCKMVFRDEELIPSCVISLVERYAKDPRYDMTWVAAPTLGNMSVMGESRTYIQWDANREWVRQPPEYAVRDIGNGGVAIKQNHFDHWIASLYTGSIALVNGIRIYESMPRMRSQFSNFGPRSFIFGTNAPRMKWCRIIYEWTATDIFKFFQDYDIHYSEMYERELWTSSPLRVATPLHDAAQEGLINLAKMDPPFWEAIVRLFPHVIPQVAYYDHVDREGVMARYEPSFAGIRSYIHDTFTDLGIKQDALRVLRAAMSAKERNMRTGKYSDVVGHGYPVRYVFYQFLHGGFLRGITPAITTHEADAEFEARTVNHGFGN